MPGFIDPIHPFIEACRDAPVITGNSERMLRIAFEVYTDAGPLMHNGTVYEVDNEYFDSAFPAVIRYLRGSQGLAPGTMVTPL